MFWWFERGGEFMRYEVSELPDAIFGWAMRLCGLTVVSLLGLIRCIRALCIPGSSIPSA